MKRKKRFSSHCKGTSCCDGNTPNPPPKTLFSHPLNFLYLFSMSQGFESQNLFCPILFGKPHMVVELHTLKMESLVLRPPFRCRFQILLSLHCLFRGGLSLFSVRAAGNIMLIQTGAWREKRLCLPQSLEPTVCAKLRFKTQVFLIDSHRQVPDEVSRKLSFSNLKSFLDPNKIGQ